MVTALETNHMVCFGKLARLVSCAPLALTLPILAAATGTDEPVNSTYLISSGRIVNAVGDTAPQAQADARAAIWALTRQVAVAPCERNRLAGATCFGTFQTGVRK